MAGAACLDPRCGPDPCHGRCVFVPLFKDPRKEGARRWARHLSAGHHLPTDINCKPGPRCKVRHVLHLDTSSLLPLSLGLGCVSKENAGVVGREALEGGECMGVAPGGEAGAGAASALSDTPTPCLPSSFSPRGSSGPCGFGSHVNTPLS